MAGPLQRDPWNDVGGLAFETARIAAWHLDFSTNVFTCSDQCLSLFGLKRHSFDGSWSSIERCVHAADLDGLRKSLHAERNGRTRNEAEFRVLSEKGELRWLLTRATNGGSTCHGVLMDVTSRKSSDEAVAILASIVTHSEDAIFTTTLAGTVTSWNHGAQQLFGYAPEQIIGQPVMRLLPPKQSGEQISALEAITRGETIRPYDTRRMHRDGEAIHVSLSMSPILNGRGQVIGSSTIARDITVHRQQTEALRQNEARLRLALRSARAGAWDLDIRKGELHWSQEMFLLYGVDPVHGVPGRAERDAMIDPAHRERVDFEYQQALKAGGSFSLEFPIHRKDGSMIWTSVVGDITKDETGHATSARGIDQDITERKTWETRQNMLLRELSHRVKNMLAVIQSMTRQTLRSHRDPDRFLSVFEGRIQSLAASHSLLTDADWRGASITDILRSQLAGMTDNLSERFRLRGPNVLLSADSATQFGLVLHELGTNALKYGALSRPKGRVYLCWAIRDGTLKILWRERGGPEIPEVPDYEGFGSALILSTAANVTRRFSPKGLSCRFEITL